MEKLRTILIGDVHGAYDDLMELVRKLQYNHNTDRIILLGDLTDRGPEPQKIIEWCRHRNIESVLGNHDEKYLRYKKHQDRKENTRSYKNPMNFSEKQYKDFKSFLPEDWDYLRSLKPIIRINDEWVAVHAGLEGYRPLEAQIMKVIIRVRYVDETGNFKGSSNPRVQPPGTTYWTEKYYQPYNVVYGHHVHSLETPRIVQAPSGAWTYGIDTGACYGGKLTALILPSLEIVQVQGTKFLDMMTED